MSTDTKSRELSDAEAELYGHWLYLYGEDPSRWPVEVQVAFANTWALLTGGAL